jgi:hypothetical protein
VKNFNDLSALSSILEELYAKGPLDPKRRREVFADFLEQQLEFTKDQASLYASTVLTRNAEGSADWVGSAAIKVLGTWLRMTQEGMSAALLTSLTETWRFSDDLYVSTNWKNTKDTCRHLGRVTQSLPQRAKPSFGRLPIRAVKIWISSSSRSTGASHAY